MSAQSFRYAEPQDCALILKFIRDLAAYEKMIDQVVATEDLLKEWIFDKKKAEVLFVCENGKALLQQLAKIAVDRGCGRLEWWCLDWNKPSIDFYLSLDAIPMDEWTVYRLTGDALRRLAEESGQ